MAGQWFVHIHGETIGPLSFETIGSLLRCARLSPADFLWTQGMPAWDRIGNLKAFASWLPPSTPQLLPPLPDVPALVGASDHSITEAVEIQDAADLTIGIQRRYWVLRMVRVQITAISNVDGHGAFPVYNLSESGIFLISPTPIPVGTKLKLKLESDELTRPIQLAGMVVRCGRTGKGDHGFALRFEDLPASERNLIQQIVKTKRIKSRTS